MNTSTWFAKILFVMKITLLLFGSPGSEKLRSHAVVHRVQCRPVALHCVVLLCKVSNHESNLFSACCGNRLVGVQAIFDEIPSKGTHESFIDDCFDCYRAAIGRHS